MGANWRIGSLFGIPLYLDASWFFVLVLVTLTNAMEMQAQGVGGWLAALLMALLLFASVLLHELGHSVVALAQGIKVNSITLFLFGGLASIEKESPNPSQAFWVAIAGPGVSFALFGLFSALTQLGNEREIWQYMSENLAQINLILALFNLIPGLPLDGGQILKALIWQITGDRYLGVRWAARCGQVLGWFGICLGLMVVFLLAESGGIWLALVGWFILRNATAYERLNQMQQSLLQIKALEVMTRDFRLVDAHLTLDEFAQEYILTAQTKPSIYYAVSEGRYRGLIVIEDLQLIERSQWHSQTLLDIAHPLNVIPSVPENAPLLRVILALEAIKDSSITVLSPAGTLAGIIDRGDIIRAIAQRQNLPIPESEIRTIKEKGAYPPYLQLQAIAKAVSQELNGNPS